MSSDSFYYTSTIPFSIGIINSIKINATYFCIDVAQAGFAGINVYPGSVQQLQIVDGGYFNSRFTLPLASSSVTVTLTINTIRVDAVIPGTQQSFTKALSLAAASLLDSGYYLAVTLGTYTVPVGRYTLINNYRTDGLVGAPAVFGIMPDGRTVRYLWR